MVRYDPFLPLFRFGRMGGHQVDVVGQIDAVQFSRDVAVEVDSGVIEQDDVIALPCTQRPGREKLRARW